MSTEKKTENYSADSVAEELEASLRYIGNELEKQSEMLDEMESRLDALEERRKKKHAEQAD